MDVRFKFGFPNLKWLKCFINFIIDYYLEFIPFFTSWTSGVGVYLKVLLKLR